ncbi:MAG TPA: glycosyltransferase, partial [Candidatus Hydrogenedentes bacterium]|nr:glycosyltransferase [Candidatus Hydrogenedentota bacterium]
VAALALKILARGKKQVVFDMHEYVAGQFAQYFPRFLRNAVERLTRLIMRFMARFTSLIILTRESFDGEWAGLPVPRITVINTTHLQPPTAEKAPELTGLGADAEIILHQGVFSAKRGAYQLLDAVARLAPRHPMLRCVVLGRYVSADEQRFRDTIREMGLEQHMVLIPEVPFSRVPSFIAGARVGLILFQPGIRNHVLAMPHKLFDYMREGCPVIAPDFAVEVARIVRESNCGLLVDVSRPEAIADAIDTLLRDPALAAELGHNGRLAVERRYHWEYDERVLLEGFSRYLATSGKTT